MTYGANGLPNSYYNGVNYTGTIPFQQTNNQSPTVSQNNVSSGFMTIFVNSEEEVNSYPVAAGLTVMLMSFDLKKFWLKGTDTSGIPKPLRSFEFEEKTPIQNQNDQFVTQKQFSDLSSKLDKLIAELGGGANAAQ